MNMKALRSLETSVITSQSTRCHTPENLNLQSVARFIFRMHVFYLSMAATSSRRCSVRLFCTMAVWLYSVTLFKSLSLRPIYLSPPLHTPCHFHLNLHSYAVDCWPIPSSVVKYTSSFYVENRLRVGRLWDRSSNPDRRNFVKSLDQLWGPPALLWGHRFSVAGYSGRSVKLITDLLSVCIL
jgi:hypothetical protein